MNSSVQKPSAKPRHINKINRAYLTRLSDAASTLSELSRLGLDVLELDINRAKPVFTVAATRAAKALGGYCYMRKCVQGTHVYRKQTLVGNCRVEWEENTFN